MQATQIIADFFNFLSVFIRVYFSIRVIRVLITNKGVGTRITQMQATQIIADFFNFLSVFIRVYFSIRVIRVLFHFKIIVASGK